MILVQQWAGLAINQNIWRQKKFSGIMPSEYIFMSAAVTHSVAHAWLSAAWRGAHAHTCTDTHTPSPPSPRSVAVQRPRLTERMTSVTVICRAGRRWLVLLSAGRGRCGEEGEWKLWLSSLTKRVTPSHLLIWFLWHGLALCGGAS